jgi:hypothetical protein
MLLDIRDEIPCATEQGINSRQTGNLIRPNRELIRDNRELGTGTEKGLKSIRSPEEALVRAVA